MTAHSLAIILYEFHPHVAILRDFAGYTVDEPEGVNKVEYTTDDTYLKSLDPKYWKDQDHYAVLGLKDVRYQASDELIRKAYRRAILRHHPDKRRSKGEQVKDESHDYFSCITKAYEILGTPSKRHAYDSVDPLQVDDSEPDISEVSEDFFNVLRPFFHKKARWSKHQPVPELGFPDTDITIVDAFYKFWDSYDTVRDFSYLDEEDKEKGEDRETRRAIERQNRAERAQKRAEELRSVRHVLHLAKRHDPRIQAANKLAREAKELKRNAKLKAAQERRAVEEQREREKAEAEAAVRAASAERRRIETERLRKEREQAKNTAKRERRRLRTCVVERHDHFLCCNQESTDPAVISAGAHTVKILAELDLLCQQLSNLELQNLNDDMESTTNSSAAASLFSERVSYVKQQLQAPGLQQAAYPKKTTGAEVNGVGGSVWSTELIQSLVKAVNLLPAGTNKRWESIAAYINQHVPNASVTGKEALKQAKMLKQDDSNLRKEANVKAFDNFASTVRESDAVRNVHITEQIEAEANRPWTLTEQRALEQALRSCPATSGSGEVDRWQMIADIVRTRTRRECMIRCKELSEQVRAKRAAISAAQKTSTS